jgi:apolipoprotein N-acyltransferase
MKQSFVSDERMQIITGRIAVVFLSLTQTAILGIILYRRYFLGQDEAYYSDIRIVLGFSVFGYIAARLYYGAVLPVLSIKKLVAIYVGFVIFLTIVLSIWLGPPTLDNWHNTILPVLLGPAILAAAYWLMAYLGKRRMEKEISEN